MGLPRRFASEVLTFFRHILQIRKQKIQNALILKRLKVETSNLHLSCGTYELFFVQILGAIGHAIRVSAPKNEMTILGLNSSSSKTNGTREITLSNLEASGHALSALKNKP